MVKDILLILSVIQNRLCYVLITHNPCLLSFKTIKIYFLLTQNVLAGLAESQAGGLPHLEQCCLPQPREAA